MVGGQDRGQDIRNSEYDLDRDHPEMIGQHARPTRQQDLDQALDDLNTIDRKLDKVLDYLKEMARTEERMAANIKKEARRARRGS